MKIPSFCSFRFRRFYIVWLMWNKTSKSKKSTSILSSLKMVPLLSRTNLTWSLRMIPRQSNKSLQILMFCCKWTKIWKKDTGWPYAFEDILCHPHLCFCLAPWNSNTWLHEHNFSQQWVSSEVDEKQQTEVVIPKGGNLKFSTNVLEVLYCHTSLIKIMDIPLVYLSKLYVVGATSNAASQRTSDYLYMQLFRHKFPSQTAFHVLVRAEQISQEQNWQLWSTQLFWCICFAYIVSLNHLAGSFVLLITLRRLYDSPV